MNESGAETADLRPARIVFHGIGGLSAVSLAVAVLELQQLHREGARPAWKALIAEFPGMEPFLIFIGPVMLAAAGAWLAYLLFRFRAIISAAIKPEPVLKKEKKHARSDG